ncbi:type II secretion system protein GspI [Phaeobacter sp. J2-8]|uniref:type II secretion system protein GspI n=1 Tax=Phaeobacter sp. J2-8 TaxID=2931394 RepID=UPI001FD58617|nr:type II secretion system protein GspI [Phaeobacter sp. J2-8]MCJ7874789.1 type II secretion system protein GspI [Phaeobacter sp. J2-8]
MRRRLGTDQASDGGLTLLELVIAVFVLAMGSIAAVRTTDQARVAIGGAKDRMLAQLAVRNRAEELRLPLGTPSLSDVVRLGGQTFTITSETLPTVSGVRQVSLSAQSERGVGARIVVYLPGRGDDPQAPCRGGCRSVAD